MAYNLFGKYISILEIIQRHGNLTLQEFNEYWVNSQFSGGVPMPRRTFYEYRARILSLFDLEIKYNRATFEYYIDNTPDNDDMSKWILNSMSINNMLTNSSDISSRIMLEDVPSANDHLAAIIDAIRTSNKIELTYCAFDRILPNEGIVIEPYFLRVFHQRWYIIGYNCRDKKIKTYALDRIQKVIVTHNKFDMPDINMYDYFNDFYGIATDSGKVKRVLLKADSVQAKYLRSLPLHKSQIEQIHDGYSIFSLNVHLTYDFIQAILALGDKVTVIGPPELVTMIKDTLKNALLNYES